MSAFQVAISNSRARTGAPIVLKRKGRRFRNTGSSSSEFPAFHPVVSFCPARDERNLVQQAIAGDSNAFHELFATHKIRLYRTAFTILRNKEDAEDAVQNGLCSAFTKLRSFQGRSSFVSWLTRVVINAALMIRRRNNGRRESSLDSILDDQSERSQFRFADTRPGPEEHCSTTEIHCLLEDQICKLPPVLRDALQLVSRDELTAVESITKLEIRQSAFKSRILRARRKLVNRLRRRLQPLTRRALGHGANLNAYIT